MTNGILHSLLSSIGYKGDVRTLETAYRDCEAKLGRPATNVEVCKELGVSLEELYEMLERSRWLGLGRIEEIETQNGGGPDSLVKYVPSGRDEEAQHIYGKAEFRNHLTRAINALPKNEQLVVFLRYRQRLTFADIAARVGFSEARVAQIHTTAMLRIRPKLLELKEKELDPAAEGRNGTAASPFDLAQCPSGF